MEQKRLNKKAVDKAVDKGIEALEEAENPKEEESKKPQAEVDDKIYRVFKKGDIML